ncbi:MAG: hypothetical protein IPK79_06495 [Vampirovibrionales bacterium]|nr:hypothetical protein [Vampirovibrionales bacterium]
MVPGTGLGHRRAQGKATHVRVRTARQLLRGMLHTWEIQQAPASQQWLNKWQNDPKYGAESREILQLAPQMLAAQGTSPQALNDPDYKIR